MFPRLHAFSRILNGTVSFMSVNMQASVYEIKNPEKAEFQSERVRVLYMYNCMHVSSGQIVVQHTTELVCSLSFSPPLQLLPTYSPNVQ